METYRTHWILEDGLLSSEQLDVFKKLKISHEIISYQPGMNFDDLKISSSTDDIVIPYVSIRLARLLHRFIGSFFYENFFQFHEYYSHALKHIPSTYWLNHDFIMTPFLDFVKNYNRYYSIFQTDSLFIRPNSGAKIFNGSLIKNDSDFSQEISSLRQLSGVQDNSLIVVSSKKSILEEYRFFIVNKKVVDGSLYIKNGDLIEKHEYPTEALSLAQMVAEHIDNIDAFTVDIAKIKINDDANLFKIIEFNAFNTSGLYQCDLTRIIPAVETIVVKNYKELNDL